MTFRALGSALLFAVAAAELAENSVDVPALPENSESAEPCCEVCVAPQVKFYSVDEEHGHCGECCLDPRMYPVFKVFEHNLTRANGKTCASLGYATYDKTETHGMPPLSVTLDLYNAGDEPVKIHRVMRGECGQLTVQRTVMATSALAVAGLQEGTCADEGYTQSVGVQSAELPMVGAVSVELFREPNFLGLAVDLLKQASSVAEPTHPGPCCSVCEASQTKYVSVDRAAGACSESCMTWWTSAAAKLYDANLELADGRSCASMGFPTYDGTSTVGAGMTKDQYTLPLKEDGPGAMRKVVDGVCAQATVGEELVGMATRMGLVHGSCVAAGYTQTVAGTSAGPLEMRLYRKVGEPSFLTGLVQQFNPWTAASLLMV